MRSCHHCRYAIGMPVVGLVCTLTDRPAKKICDQWEREPGSDDDLCTQTNPLTNGSASATAARCAT